MEDLADHAGFEGFELWAFRTRGMRFTTRSSASGMLVYWNIRFVCNHRLITVLVIKVIKLIDYVNLTFLQTALESF